MASLLDDIYRANITAALGKRVMDEVNTTGAMDQMMGRQATARVLTALHDGVARVARRMVTAGRLHDLGIRDVADLDGFALEVTVETERFLDQEYPTGTVVVAWKARA